MRELGGGNLRRGGVKWRDVGGGKNKVAGKFVERRACGGEAKKTASGRRKTGC